MITLFNENKSYDYLKNFITCAMQAKIGLLRSGVLSSNCLLENFVSLLPKEKYELVSTISGQDTIFYIRSKDTTLSLKSIEEDILYTFSTFLTKYKEFIYNLFSNNAFVRDNIIFTSRFPSLMYSLESFPNSMFAIRI